MCRLNMYGNSNWLLVGLNLSCNPGCTMYTVCVFLGNLDVMEERETVCYAIAHKNMLFFISVI